MDITALRRFDRISSPTRLMEVLPRYSIYLGQYDHYDSSMHFLCSYGLGRWNIHAVEEHTLHEYTFITHSSLSQALFILLPRINRAYRVASADIPWITDDSDPIQ